MNRRGCMQAGLMLAGLMVSGEVPAAGPAASPWEGLGLAGCAAALVAPAAILLPAHCVAVQGAPGAVRFRGVSAPARVESCTSHPRFDGSSSDYDLTVCRLASEVTEVAPLPLARGFPSAGEGAGLPVVVVRAEQDGPTGAALPPPRVVGATVSQFPNPTTALLRETFCGGDSGSGVFVWQDSQWQLLGLVSGGAGARCSGETRVVRLGPLTAWIEADARVALQ